MAVGTFDMTNVNLVPKKLKMGQAVDMPIFRITDWKLEKKHFEDDRRGISMVVVMKRKITSEMMTTRVSLCDDFFVLSANSVWEMTFLP